MAPPHCHPSCHPGPELLSLHRHTFSLLAQPPGPQGCQFCRPAHSGPNSGTSPITCSFRWPGQPARLCPELLICLQAALQLSSLLHQSPQYPIRRAPKRVLSSPWMRPPHSSTQLKMRVRLGPPNTHPSGSCGHPALRECSAWVKSKLLQALLYFS